MSFFILSTVLAFAQDEPTLRDKRLEIREDFQADVEVMQEKRDSLRTTVIEERSDVRDARSDIREDFQGDVDEARQQRDELQGERPDRREAVEAKRADLQEKRDERRAELKERSKDRIKAYATRIVRRLGAAAERLTKLADRMDSRIDKLEERGIDLSVARGLLDTARAEIANAQADVDAIEVAVEEALATDNPKEAFGAVRELLRGSKDSIKAAHRVLVEAIREIKAGVSVRPESEVDEGDEEENEADEAEGGDE